MSDKLATDVSFGKFRKEINDTKPQKREDWHDPEATPEGTVFAADDLQCSASTVLLCKHVADKLHKHFPGWFWAVQPEEKQGMLNIFCGYFSMDWGYRLKITSIQDDPNLRRVLEAGGEILERYGMPRKGFHPKYLRRIRRSWTGEPIPDLSDRDKKESRRFHAEAGTHGARVEQALNEGRLGVYHTTDGGILVKDHGSK